MFGRKTLQIQAKGDLIIEMLEGRLDGLVGTLKNFELKFVEETLANPPGLDNSSTVLQNIAAAKKHLSQQQDLLQRVSAFIELLRDINLPQLSTMKLYKKTDAEHVFEESERLIEDARVLWTRIAAYHETLNLAKNSEFLKLDYAGTKASALGFRKFVETQRKGVEAKFGCQKLYPQLISSATELETLIDSTEILQKLVDMPQAAISKATAKLGGEKFRLFDLSAKAFPERVKRELEAILEDFAGEARVMRELRNIRAEIERAELVIKPMHDDTENTTMFIFTDYEGLFDLFESAAVRLEVLGSNPAAGGEQSYKTELETLRKEVQQLQGSAEQLLLAQDKWLQLRKMMECKALCSAVPAQLKSLQEQETVMLNITGNLSREPSASKSLLKEPLMSQLTAVNEGLQKIQKDVEELLENKKVQMPRLLFLSNTQLVEFFTGVQTQSFTHIQRLFPGIRRLLLKQSKAASALPSEPVYADPEPLSATKRRVNVVKWLNEEKEEIFRRKNNRDDESKSPRTTEIEGIVGDDDELLRLTEGIPLQKCEGLGEDLKWVLQLEVQMQQTVAKNIAHAINSFDKAALEEWVLDFPLQVILTAAHMIITHEMSELLQPELEGEDPAEQSKDLEEAEEMGRGGHHHVPEEIKKEQPVKQTKVWSPLVLEAESEDDYRSGKSKDHEIVDMFSSFSEDPHFPSIITECGYRPL